MNQLLGEFLCQVVTMEVNIPLCNLLRYKVCEMCYPISFPGSKEIGEVTQMIIQFTIKIFD